MSDLRNFALDLKFTDSQYEEAIKRIKSTDSANQLLLALLELSTREDNNSANSNNNDYDNQQLNINQDFHQLNTGQTKNVNSNDNINGNNKTYQANLDDGPNLMLDERESSSSCYSSLSNFQSQESLMSFDKRDIFIDGSNVARSHGKDITFSWLGIRICVDYFLSRNHKVKVFVPEDKCQPNSLDDDTKEYLNQHDVLIKTPSGCNDDMFVIEAALRRRGIIVSNDHFRNESNREELRKFIPYNRLPFVFVDDDFIPAPDPLGAKGPNLDWFLSHEVKTDNDNFNISLFNHRSRRNGSLVKPNSQSQVNRLKRYSLQPIRNSTTAPNPAQELYPEQPTLIEIDSSNRKYIKKQASNQPSGLEYYPSSQASNNDLFRDSNLAIDQQTRYNDQRSNVSRHRRAIYMKERPKMS